MEPIAIGITLLAIEPFIETMYNLVDFVVSGRFLLLGANYDDFASQENDSLIQLSKWARFIYKWLSYFKVVTLILFFYYLSLPNRRKWVIVGLFMASTVPMLFNISIGSKTEAIFYILSFIGFYLLLKDSYVEKTKIFLKRFLVLLSSIVVIVAVALSIGRYTLGNNYMDVDTGDFLTQYTSESMYNFNGNAIHEERHLLGFETMQPVLITLGLTDVQMRDRYTYLQTRMNTSPRWFYSYIGDLVIDWGTVGTFILICFLSYMFSQIKIRSEMRLEDLMLLGIYIYMMINGLFYFCYKSTWGPVYANVFMYIVIKFFNGRYAK